MIHLSVRKMDYKLTKSLMIPLDRLDALRSKHQCNVEFIRIFNHIDSNIETIFGSDYMKCYYYQVKLQHDYDFIKLVSSNNKYSCSLVYKSKDSEIDETFLMMMSKDTQVFDISEESKYYTDILKFIESYNEIV